MSDFGEAIGTATEGGLFARVIGGKGGGLTDKEGNPLKKGHFAEGACLNCGTQLLGAHCHECGQKAHLHRTVGGFLHDLLHGALHLDGKVWRTLPMLIAKPGELTRRYIEGERMRFVSPMAMFLFSVFLMFAVFQAVGLTAPTTINGSAQIESGVQTAKKGAEAELKAAEERLAAAEEGSPEHEKLEARVMEAQEALDAFESVGSALAKSGSTTMSFTGTGIKTIDEGIVKKWKENPGLMLYKMQANGYKFSWLLIPLSIPFVWLIFAWKRRFKAYDHAIFVTYSLAFMSLLFILLSVLSAAGIGGGWVFLGLAIVPPIHIYKHLRHAYGLGRFSAFWRLSALLFFIIIVIVLFLQALLLLGAF